ncbi:superoxide dismutase family protein [Cellulomonas aerilata]|nr:superoxide dismutase family protein [Cellulomonas aerilata]
MRTASTTALALCAVGVLGVGPAAAHDDHGRSGDRDKVVTKQADLAALNGSGASGKATVVVRGDEILRVRVRAEGLTPDAPHAQHIHYGQQALNECPGVAQDLDADGRLTTVEGIPAYGPVAVSLTTTGDTSPASVLAVPRYPFAEKGRINYRRTHVPFSDVAGAGAGGGTASAAQVADAVRRGEGVVVVHGVDYDGDGTYSFSRGGASELDPSLPAEATDPAICGLLR